MNLRVSTCFVMLTYCFWYGDARKYNKILIVKNGAPWGDWAKPKFCKEGYAKGFALKVEDYQGSLAWNDDTGLNGIRLYCDDGQAVMSKSGDWGAWKKAIYCPKGHLMSFSLQVEPYQGTVVDDSAANNVRFGCSEGAVLTGDSHNWGYFGAWSESCSSGAICGVQTRIEPPQGNNDDTALNDVKFFCCD
ncbi:vitelline membrane outer layer protein 1-like [Anolis sagrei]|uniref:vitelline membrane outer layer protein 1-like n=1 Tax=Anolis sagrei TaxID=38937 RepID=UPI00295AD8C0|nr:vitelline membrane outer layer protein 1-like [Anolis sagrei ordinatus]